MTCAGRDDATAAPAVEARDSHLVVLLTLATGPVVAPERAVALASRAPEFGKDSHTLTSLRHRLARFDTRLSSVRIVHASFARISKRRAG